MNDITLEHRGKQYTLLRNRDQVMAPDPRSAPTPSTAPDRWHLMLGPTALTTFAAIPGESDASLRDRIIAWLDANPDLQGRDQIVLGGG